MESATNFLSFDGDIRHLFMIVSTKPYCFLDLSFSGDRSKIGSDLSLRTQWRDGSFVDIFAGIGSITSNSCYQTHNLCFSNYRRLVVAYSGCFSKYSNKPITIFFF